MASLPPVLIPLEGRAIDARTAGLLAKAFADAARQSAANIDLHSAWNVGSGAVWGIIKGKFGFFWNVGKLGQAIYDRNWDAFQAELRDVFVEAVGIGTIMEAFEAIQNADNGRAAVALMKNPDYKSAIGKQD